MENSVSRTTSHQNPRTPDDKGKKPQVDDEFVGIKFGSLWFDKDDIRPWIHNSDGESSRNATNRSLTIGTTSGHTQSLCNDSNIVPTATPGLEEFTSSAANSVVCANSIQTTSGHTQSSCNNSNIAPTAMSGLGDFTSAANSVVCANSIQTTSGHTQSLWNDSNIAPTATPGLEEFTSTANSIKTTSGHTQREHIIPENSSHARNSDFNDQGSASNVHRGNSLNNIFAQMGYNPTNGMRHSERIQCNYAPYTGGDNISKNLGVGSSSRQGKMVTSHQSQPDIGHIELRNTDVGTSCSCDDPIILDAPANPFTRIEIDELRSSDAYDSLNRSLCNLQIGSQGRETEFTRSQETLGNRIQRRPRTLFSQFQGSFLELMTDTFRSFIFEHILEDCGHEQLDSLVQEIWRNPELFIRAAFSKEGSNSINKLIKRIKKTTHPYTLTRLLAPDLYNMMTDNTAKSVIKQCLEQFGSRANEILYDIVILNHRSLAIHEVGCRSLNDCIRTISGIQKMILLENIADMAVFLSNDRFGNYVVQQAMTLGHDIVAPTILARLCGHFTQLSLEKGGSHVVEKCLTSSSIGTALVVEEILLTPSAPFELARHHYGNYVIQAALKNLEKQQNEILYMALVEALEPHFIELQWTTGGKKVINLITSNISTHHPYWPGY